MKKETILTVAAIIVIIAAGVYFITRSSSGPAGSNSGTPVVSNDFSKVPDPSTLSANMQKAGLDLLTSEGTVLHIHQHLDININGTPIQIPAEIGVAPSFISAIHTHDTTGVLHVESPVNKDFKLGQFFDEWGITFNDSCIATYCNDDNHKLIVAVNGNQINNARDYILKEHDEIEIWYGAKSENPQLIKNFNFPAGL